MPEPAAALPEDAVLLHIGPHKTGTTAIQGTLAMARQDLAAHGVTYPGPRGAHHDAARVILGRPAGWSHDSAPLPDESVWRDLVTAIHESPGRVVVSSEFFALIDADGRARVVEEIGRDRLYLLVAARNPGSIALSTWQQVLREGKTGRLEDWLQRSFRRPEPGYATEGFWSWAEPSTLVEDWSQAVDLDRIRVVVIDETDRALLPTTFEQLLGLPAETLSTRTPPSPNRSLTAPEAELLRCATALTKAQLRWDEFSLFFRMGYARRMLDVRVPPRCEARLVLPTWAASQVAAEAGTSIERLLATGVSVIGDLESLRRVPAVADAEPIEQVPVDLAAEALAGVVTAAQRRIRTAERRVKRLTAAASDRPRALDEISTRELAAVLRARVRARFTRRTGARPGA
jgi:hypothetical protein